MTPEYLYQLADIADPENLWKLDLLSQLDLPEDKKKQLDMGIALRRYAFYLKYLARAVDQNKSILITPKSANVIAKKLIDTPEDHAFMRNHQPQEKV